ncbi:MAG: heavy metal-binding domain-containing protein, partial [Gammaproteobacteria bacterium]|nr:heavy metal-binding domain-containing protein [Gammaproteobacteria bacterium]
SRGAHAVVGVTTEIQQVGEVILVSAVGTAVTLKSPA